MFAVVVVHSANVLTNAAMWAGIVGFLMPVVIQQIVKVTKDAALQSVLAFLACLVAGAGTAYFAAELNVHDFVTSALIVFTLAMVSYHALWNKTGVLPTSTGSSDPNGL